MSEENNEMKNKTFDEYIKLATSQLQELIDNFEKDFDITQNEDAKKYVEELKNYILEIKKTLENEEVSPEKEEVFADYIEELIEKYSNFYLLMLANESLKQLAEQNPAEYEKMPNWENVFDSNEANEYNPYNNLENMSDEELEQLTKDNPIINEFYNYIVNSVQNQIDSSKDETKTNNENESEK